MSAVWPIVVVLDKQMSELRNLHRISVSFEEFSKELLVGPFHYKAAFVATSN